MAADEPSRQKPAIEILADMAEQCETLAKAYRPGAPGEPANPNADEREHAKWSKLAVKVRAHLAPYLPPGKRGIKKSPHVSSERRITPEMTVADVAEEMFKALKLDFGAGEIALSELYDRLEKSEPETAKKIWTAASRIAVRRFGENEEARDRLERFFPGDARPN
jgi:hypothetical protein